MSDAGPSKICTSPNCQNNENSISGDLKSCKSIKLEHLEMGKRFHNCNLLHSNTVVNINSSSLKKSPDTIQQPLGTSNNSLDSIQKDGQIAPRPDVSALANQNNPIGDRASKIGNKVQSNPQGEPTNSQAQRHHQMSRQQQHYDGGSPQQSQRSNKSIRRPNETKGQQVPMNITIGSHQSNDDESCSQSRPGEILNCVQSNSTVSQATCHKRSNEFEGRNTFLNKNKDRLIDDEDDEDSEADSEEFDYEPILTRILNEKKLTLATTPDVLRFLNNIRSGP